MLVVYIRAITTFTLWSAGKPSVKAFTIFLFALWSLTIADLFFRCILRSVTPNASHILHFFHILHHIVALATRTLLGTSFPWLKTLAIQFQAACLLANAASFLLFFGGFETLRSFNRNIFLQTLCLWFRHLFKRNRIVMGVIGRLKIHIVEWMDGLYIAFGNNQTHFVGEAELLPAELG